MSTLLSPSLMRRIKSLTAVPFRVMHRPIGRLQRSI